MRRRAFLKVSSALVTGIALDPARALLRACGWSRAEATGTALLCDTYNGLLAFVVPGGDAFSIAQGVTTSDSGGVDAGATDAIIATLEGAQPGAATAIAVVLNSMAESIAAGGSGPFVSAFANLSFADKARVFESLEAVPALRFVIGVLPAVAAFAAYSEAGTFDTASRTLTARPVGWELSGYTGVADGRDERIGYFRRRRRARETRGVCRDR